MFDKIFNNDNSKTVTNTKTTENSFGSKKTSKQTYIRRIMKASGWSEKETIDNVEKLKQNTGIKYREYCNYKMYSVPENMQIERYKAIKKQRAARKESEQEQLNILTNVTGWSEEKAETNMKLLKDEVGLTPEEYMEFRIYAFPESERIERARKLLAENIRASERDEKNIISIMEKTGWSHDEVVENVENLRSFCNITYKDYLKNELFQLTEDEQSERAKEIAEKTETRLVHKEENIKEIMNSTGWSRGKVIETVTALKSRMGMTYKNYAKYELYNIPEDELEAKYSVISMKATRKEKKARKNERLIHKVMKSTGWEYDEAKKHMDEAKKISGAEYKDYYAYKFWELTPDVQKTYFTKGCANALRKKYNVNKDNFSYFMNKDQFDEMFSEFLGRPWCRNRDIDFEAFKERFKTETKIMYKPLSASCGAGITIFPLDDNMEETYNQIMELPIGIVEGVLVQHHEMSKFSKNAVNTIRLISINDGNAVNVVYGAFRMAGGDAVVDNFHNGGVLAILDVEKGEVITDAIDLSGNFYKKHPATGEVIKGFKIPYWNDIVAMIKKAGTYVQGVGYVGWDIAITEHGPVLIEGNTAPAPNVLQLPFAKDKKGMRYVVEKYL